MKKFHELTEREVLALAISLEEEDERVYADFAEGLRQDYPASAAMFEGMREELGDDAAEEEKIKSAQALYRWVETQAGFPIRPRCNEPFVTRGTFHILANGQRLGWHPDFADRLRLILEKSEADS